jgi:hypothetical protein
MSGSPVSPLYHTRPPRKRLNSTKAHLPGSDNLIVE